MIRCSSDMVDRIHQHDHVMGDSDQDFVDFSSKLLKRVRKKPGEPTKPTRKADLTTSGQRCAKEQRGRKPEEDSGWSSAAPPRGGGGGGEQEEEATSRGGSQGSGGAGSAGHLRAKDKVLLRMQKFKRASPQRMGLGDGTKAKPRHGALASPRQEQENGACLGAAVLNGDEALALRLQLEMDQEAAEAQTVDLEDGGLFFCQICQRDLSHMTPEGRTHHLNRCLDESEARSPAPSVSSGVPDCPICGKKFKSQKSCWAHLKRCSSDMDVPAAVLLQALQRGAQENRTAANTGAETAGAKRKSPSTSRLPVMKRFKRKKEPLDEETQLALALSTSLQEKEKEEESVTALQTEAASSHSATALKWRPDGGRGCGKKKKKATCPRPPPLLLIQDAKMASTRLQERVSALLLRCRAPSPPTPSRQPSALPGRTGDAPLWRKSALLAEGSAGPQFFCVAELQEFFTPSESIKTYFQTPSNIQPDSSLPSAGRGPPATESHASVPPLCSQNASFSLTPPTPRTGELSVGSQALRDLMELAEEGMTLTQYGYSAEAQHLSGFIQEESEEQEGICSSGLLAETGDPHIQVERLAAQDNHPHSHHPQLLSSSALQKVALSRLSSDLSGMVNNPQLSDVQLQVDSGELFHAHSFMLYARCPLLAEMLHESGFRVQEEGSPAAQRVVLSDVPGQAVLMLLQYLYTSQCSVPAALRPHMLELASRFDLQELQQLCRLHPKDASMKDPEEDRTDKAFVDLLRSMWDEEEDEAADLDEGGGDGKQVVEDRGADEVILYDREISEERINEEELEEIYEFAATQKTEEEEESEEEEEAMIITHLFEPQKSFTETVQLESDQFLDCCGSKSQTVHRETEASSSSNRTPTRSGNGEGSDRPFLQSSWSSLSPPPRTFSLPGPGLSPGHVEGRGFREDHRDAAAELDGPLKPQSPDAVRPPSSLQREEPEFIVLSDSGEENHNVPCSPDKNRQSYTQIRSRQDSSPAEEGKQPRGLDFGPVDPPVCSPEVSWLTFTPVQAERSSRSSSTQTRSSMCRTKLFSRVDSSSPTSPSSSRRQTCNSHRDVSASSSQSCVSRLKHSQLPLRSEDEEQLHSQPCISTPLQTDHHQPADLLAASPLPPDNQPSQRRSSENSDWRRVHASPQSKPSASSSSSSRRRPSESSSCGSPGLRVQRMEAGSDADAEQEEGKGPMGAEGGESSLQQSFTDEPPIAYNDSWGLDVYEDAGPACFSLRLEDGSGSSLQEPHEASRSSSSASSEPVPAGHRGQPGPRGLTSTSTPQSPRPQTSRRSPPASPPHSNHTPPRIQASLLDSQLWDSWGEEDEALPLSQRVNPAKPLKTPAPSHRKRRGSVVPITPMPSFSDMDTPELKGKLNRFGVRPLPKRQMILKLKEIHQYTHQLASSDSEEDTPPQVRGPPGMSCDQTGTFKEPRAPAAGHGADAGQLSASQGSNTSSAACSDESERSNQEFFISSDGDSDSDGCISSSQAATRLQDRLQAVRNFILSNPELYSQILQYRPLVLPRLQEQLKAAGIRLGAAKLVDYLDSQCITFTTAKPGRPGKPAARGNRAGRGAKAANRKKAAASIP